MRLRMPAGVQSILTILNANGFEAFAVGGCVRDSILGRVPDDWDITTSATPFEVKALFPRTVDTGLQHGTVTVLMGKDGYEVTTYRIDGDYEDGRHPKEVIFTGNLSEDLKRRDFTINAMAYSEETGLVDLFGGMEDLQRKVIRCVGDPEQRFGEDALRILRAVRFAAQLGFAIEEETRQAICTLAPTLEKISAERICTELNKLLLSDRPQMIRTAWETGITKVVLPEFDRMMETPQNNPHHRGTVGEHTLWALPEVPSDRVLRWTMLLHDSGKPEKRTTDANGVDHFIMHGEAGEKLSKQVMRRLRMDNDTIRQVAGLVRCHDYRVQPEKKAVRKAINRVGEDLFPLLLKVQYADTVAQSAYQQEEKFRRITQVEALYEEICRDDECVSLKSLAVTGRDLIAAGVKPGPGLGEILQALLEVVLEDPEKNEKDVLLDLAEKMR